MVEEATADENKIKILVEPADNGQYLASCNWDDYMQLYTSKVEAVYEAERHFRANHPEEVAKRATRLAAASEASSLTPRQWKDLMRKSRRRKK